MPTNYKINNNNLITRDQQSVKSHIKQGDYFGTTATVLSLLSQKEFIDNKKDLKKYLKKISKELVYLQKNFDIIKKP